MQNTTVSIAKVSKIYSMIPNKGLSREDAELTVASARNHSDSSSYTDVQEKTEVDQAQTVKTDSEQQSENITAYLQVVGAFFLMFNSWQVHRFYSQ